jgi:23S rRNA (cytidine1920-2'-O)/16S rRNA (cytidine1409-2'-O)-methyltransferase
MGRKRGRRLRKVIDVLARTHPHLQDPEDAIVRGFIRVGGSIVTNPASLVPETAGVAVHVPAALRGELKLRAALAAFDVDVRARVALDVGAAAGGFTRALLDAGARRVYAVDAGYGQLVGSLRQDPRVVNLERTNVSELERSRVPEDLDVVTLDLSYLSLACALPQLDRLGIDVKADLVALVKPMFELELAAPPTARRQLDEAVARAAAAARATGWAPVSSIESPVRGARGTVEYFLHARRGPR